MPAAAASKNGSIVMAIRAIPRLMRWTGLSSFRSPRPATTCSESWRIFRSIARDSAAGPGCRSRPICTAAQASNSERLIQPSLYAENSAYRTRERELTGNKAACLLAIGNRGRNAKGILGFDDRDGFDGGAGSGPDV